MTKKRVSINGITRWKEINPAPQQVAPAVEEAKTVPLRQAIGEVLRDVRQRQGRTLREVSQSARVSLGYLSEVERGQKEASSELLAWICQALDIPMYQMLREVADRMAILEGVHVPDTVPAELAEQYRNDYMMASL
ncbi:MULTISPECIES: helix-turn-helix domain-containing protein [Rothia]|uniref:helix-turn-helix domain-containing protein n=1 Tax=Rothia TaxID=32207 RepID=UPI0006612CEB|nr:MULTISPECIES: helix-turn-helix transcriptional regulator [Rothia]OFO74014.1 transcriptional regulator [Rothia sp. HMSC065D02]